MKAVVRWQVDYLRTVGQNIFRQHHNDGAGTAIAGGMKSPTHDFGQTSNIVHLLDVLGQSVVEKPVVDLLKGLASKCITTHLANE